MEKKSVSKLHRAKVGNGLEVLTKTQNVRLKASLVEGPTCFNQT